MTPNPYAPPDTPPDPPTAGEPALSPRLFTATAVAVHTLLVPIFGAVLAVINYRRSRNPRGVLRATAMFVVPSLALVFFGIAARTGGRQVLVMGARIWLAAIAYRDQQVLVRDHFAAGGRKARWVLGWLVVLPSVVAILVVWQILQP